MSGIDEMPGYLVEKGVYEDWRLTQEAYWGVLEAHEDHDENFRATLSALAMAKKRYEAYYRAKFGCTRWTRFKQWFQWRFR